MIPPDEVVRLHDCVREAWELAEQGHVLRGYGVLKLGLTWAETPAIHPVTVEQSPPEPWAAALADLYRRELLRYAAAHHHVLGSCCLSGHAEALREPARGQEAASASELECSAPLEEPVTNVSQRVRAAREHGLVH